MTEQTMWCGYCTTLQPWDREHFLDRLHAKCRRCMDGEMPSCTCGLAGGVVMTTDPSGCPIHSMGAES